MHSGDIAIRLRNVTLRMASGDSRSTSGTSRSCLLWHWVSMAPSAMLPDRPARAETSAIWGIAANATGELSASPTEGRFSLLPSLLPSLFSSYWDMIVPSFKNTYRSPYLADPTSVRPYSCSIDRTVTVEPQRRTRARNGKYGHWQPQQAHLIQIGVARPHN